MMPVARRKMGVRRRAVRERLQRKAAYEKGMADFNRSLARCKRVVDEALAEGLKTLSREEFGRRLATIKEEANP
jgi:hypothetical protein